MFKTLHRKLFFSYAVVAVLCLLLALLVGLALARDIAQRSRFENLLQKQSLLIPIVQLIELEERRPVPTRRATPLQIVANRLTDVVRRSGVRLLILDPQTMRVERDTSELFDATGKTFEPLAKAGSSSERLANDSIQGSYTFPGEGVKFQYVARSIPELPVAGTTPPGSARRSILVMMEREPNYSSLVGDFAGLALLATGAAILISLVFSYALARSISKPVTQLSEAATAMARGSYGQLLPVRGQDELAVLTQRFNEMSTEVERAHSMQRDFVANVSHDLKTPLTSIQGFSQAMLDGSISNPGEYRQAARIINDEAGRMGRLVNQLFSLIHLQQGLLHLEKRPLALNTLLSEVVLAAQPQAQAAGVELLFREPVAACWVLADADRFKQALGNLMDNAIRHTPPGGSVTLGYRLRDSEAELELTDTGKGIPREDVPRVAERFYQVDKSRTGKGGSAGLGLSIAAEIVRAHGGVMTIESSLGAGTTVRIALPAGSATAHNGSDGPGKATGPFRRRAVPPASDRQLSR